MYATPNRERSSPSTICPKIGRRSNPKSNEEEEGRTQERAPTTIRSVVPISPFLLSIVNSARGPKETKSAIETRERERERAKKAIYLGTIY
jgi:hypothetical protein